MLKMPTSAAMRQSMPTLPREGSRHSALVSGKDTDTALIRGSSFVFPVWVFRVLGVPERPAALYRGYDAEVVGRWRRRRGPFEGPGIPGIVAGLASIATRGDEVIDK